MPPNDWVEEAEFCVTRATDLLILDATLCEWELTAAARQIQQAVIDPRNASLDDETCDRLQALRRKLVVLQETTKYVAALHTGLEQLDPTAVIGYTPAGLERAL